MAKTAAERKAAQRARQAEAGERKLELVLDEQEMAAQQVFVVKPHGVLPGHPERVHCSADPPG